MNLVQLQSERRGRAVARVNKNALEILSGPATSLEWAEHAAAIKRSLKELIAEAACAESISYDDVWNGVSEWRLLPPLDHPVEPARCHVTGTGLTLLASAENRAAMHAATQQITDSMRMYQWGVEGGRPHAGVIGASPEWFYKGNGSMLRGHGDALEIPAFAEDGGEEPEIAGVYFIDNHGNPRRIGMAQGNEFSDHIFEKKNYLYLASSKLRTCSLGPELVLDPDFRAVSGKVRILRQDAVLWEKEIRAGEDNMCHSLENIEHHHFKFPLHRRPGDAHVHFFGASAFSFGAQIRLQDGDVMEIAFDHYGRPLRNTVRMEGGEAKPARVLPL
ncbi:MAG: GguC protein [Candidatus Solibacter usitatus]|nr:GguC protein [Candidatus Solibacter usitatus]